MEDRVGFEPTMPLRDQIKSLSYSATIVTGPQYDVTKQHTQTMTLLILYPRKQCK